MEFKLTFAEETELIGPLKLRLWVEAKGDDDADIFVPMQKLRPKGKPLVTRVINFPNPLLRVGLTLLNKLGIVKLGILFYKGPRGRHLKLASRLPKRFDKVFREIIEHLMP